MEVQDSKWYGLNKSVQSIKQDCLNIDSPVIYSPVIYRVQGV